MCQQLSQEIGLYKDQNSNDVLLQGAKYLGITEVEEYLTASHEMQLVIDMVYYIHQSLTQLGVHKTQRMHRCFSGV